MKKFILQFWCGLRGHADELVADAFGVRHIRVRDVEGPSFVGALLNSYLWCPRCGKETRG